MHSLLNHFLSKKALYQSLLALLSGASLTLAFAPFDLYLLAIVSPVVLLSLWHFSTPKRAFFLGWLFGFSFFSTGVYWIYISIHTFGHAPAVLAFIITFLFLLLLGFFFGAQGWLTRKIFKGNHLFWGFSIIWVLFELFRSYFLTGFPWLLIGYSQTETLLRFVAPISGVYGVSFLVLVLSSILSACLVLKGRYLKLGMTGLLLFIAFALWNLSPLSWGVSSTGKALKVSLVQGNISQAVKWDIAHIADALKKYETLTESHWDSDLIVWPEAAIPLAQDEIQFFLDRLEKKANQHDTALALGIVMTNAKQEYFNSVLMLGKGEGYYWKRNLVPFGEYVPFRKQLSFILNHIEIPMSDMSSGQKKQPLLMAKGFLFGPSICFEVAYSNLIASQLPEAQILLNLTDDGWFDGSIAKYQQLQIAQMRALEMGRYFLVATNDGMTALIDPKGRVIQEIEPEKDGVLTVSVPAMKGATPWVRFLNIIN